jgi:hypothetical protein
MTKFVRLAALAASAALLATPALAANSDSKPFTAKAKIVKPLVLTNDTDLDFGVITMGSTLTSANVVIGRTGGTATTSCGTGLTCLGGSAAGFTVAGVALQGLDVDVVAPATLDDAFGNTVAFSVDAPATLTLDDKGDATFDIGGSITVAASTVDGDYSNTVDVTVSYN